MLAKFIIICLVFGQLNAADILNSTDCNTRYGCFYSPENCEDNRCEFVAKWRQNNDQVEFIVAAKFKNLKRNWLAIGFSYDKTMGNDSVVACKFNTESNLKVENYYNPGRFDPELIDLTEPSTGLSDIKVINDKGTLICSFKRDKSKGIENFFDLNQNYYLLMAKGDLEKDGALTYHGGDKVISQKKIDFNTALEAKSVSISTNYVKIHAILMVIAWPLLSTIGILFARYYKSIFPNVKITGVQFWFVIHRPFMITVTLMSLIGFGFILSYKNWSWTSVSSTKNFAHSIVGLITIMLSLVQPVMAFFRPDKLAENRPIFNLAHRSVGFLAYASSITAVFLGVNIFVKNYHWIGLLAWIIWLIILIVLLEVFHSKSSTDKVHEKNNELKIDENELNVKLKNTYEDMENKNQPKKKTQLSIIIRDSVEKLNRSGINCIKFEKKSTRNDQANLDRLYTAGRDSTIRVYSNLVPHTNESGKYELNNVDQYYQMSLSHHTDWVNDIYVCKNSNRLFSASSDTTVKIWNTNKGSLITTLRNHKDYVKCLAYAKDKQILASAGFDKNIYLWDINKAVSINTNDLDTNTISENKYSIYSLAINNQATVLASGSPENCIRLWDPRTNSKLMKLRGHTHNIRFLALNRDATQCLSASTDHTIRLWSLAQQRCISTIEIHTEGVWTLCVNESFSKVYSGGKDCKIYATDLRNLDESVLVCEESDPVLSIDLGDEQESLWVSTTSSTFKNWNLKPSEKSSWNQLKNSLKPSDISLKPSNDASNQSGTSSMSSSFLMQSPINTNPLISIPGTSCIKHYHISNDKRYIITKDSDEVVCVWDVLQARKLETLGKENFENAIKLRQRFISVPNWFTVDLKLGVLTVNFDESDWQSAWINFKDMDSNHVRQTQNIDLSDAKVNYGHIFLESLFKTCPLLNPNQSQTCGNVIMNSQQTNSTLPSIISKDLDNNQPGLLRFNIPEHTPIILSESAGRTLHRLEVRDLAKESEQQILSKVIPSWINDALSGKTAPKFNRINFVLNPFNQNQKVVNKEKLSSIDLLQVKKLKEHVYSKILKLDQTGENNQNDSNNNNYKKSEPDDANGSQDALQNANRTIELLCSDQILNDPEMNLRTIKHLIWKGSGDLIILYRQK